MSSKFKNANVSLTTVLVIGAMLLLSGAVLIISSLNLVENSSSFVNYKLSIANSTTCLEEAMAIIKANPAYTGQKQLSVNSGSCTFLVESYQPAPAKRLITTTGAIGSSSYIVKFLADPSSTPIKVKPYVD